VAENICRSLVLIIAIVKEKFLTVPSTEKKREGSSWPMVQVEVAKTPNGKVKAHHPILNGNFLDFINVATAKESQTTPKAHSKIPIKNPTL
jgi:hypothetical protein